MTLSDRSIFQGRKSSRHGRPRCTSLQNSPHIYNMNTRYCNAWSFYRHHPPHCNSICTASNKSSVHNSHPLFPQATHTKHIDRGSDHSLISDSVLLGNLYILYLPQSALLHWCVPPCIGKKFCASSRSENVPKTSPLHKTHE